MKEGISACRFLTVEGYYMLVSTVLGIKTNTALLWVYKGQPQIVPLRFFIELYKKESLDYFGREVPLKSIISKHCSADTTINKRSSVRRCMNNQINHDHIYQKIQHRLKEI